MTGSLMFRFKDGRSYKWRTLSLPPSLFLSPSSRHRDKLLVAAKWKYERRSWLFFVVPATRRRERGEGQPINSDKNTSNFLLVNAAALSLSLSIFISLKYSRREKNFVKHGPRTGEPELD